MHQHVLPAIGHKVTVSRHLQIAGIFAVKRDGDHGAAVEVPSLPVRQFDDVSKSQLPKQRQVVVEKLLPIAPAGNHDRHVFRHMQQGPGIHVVIVVMGQKDRGRFRQHRAPEARHIRLREPGQQPGVKQQEPVLLSIHQRGMAQMNHVPILGIGQPLVSNRGVLRRREAFVLNQQLHQLGQQPFTVPSGRRHDRLNRPGLLRAIQHPQQFSDHRSHRTLKRHRNRLTFHGIEDSQAAVDHGRGFRRIEGMRPVKLPIRLTPGRNVLTQLLSGIDQLGIGVFQPYPGLWVAECRATGEHIADGGFHTGKKEAVGFVQTRHHLRGHTADEGEWPRRLITLKLHPHPGGQPDILIARQCIPNTHGGQAGGKNSILLIVGSYNA